MCHHLSIKLSDTFAQNPHCTFEKTLSQLELESKGQGHSKKQKPMPWGTKNMPPKQNLSRGSISNWCDAKSCILLF